MDGYEQLRTQARQKRDQAIRQARADYRRTLREINRIRFLIVGEQRGKRVPVERREVRVSANDGPYGEMTAIEAARRVLTELGPLRLVEVTLEVQRRGCRTGDNPRRVMNAIRQAMVYHAKTFRRNKTGKWSIAPVG